MGLLYLLLPMHVVTCVTCVSRFLFHHHWTFSINIISVNTKAHRQGIKNNGEAAVATYVQKLVGMLLLPTPSSPISCYEICKDKRGKLHFLLVVCHFRRTKSDGRAVDSKALQHTSLLLHKARQAAASYLFHCLIIFHLSV
jgi:hypothetical protein